MDRPLLLTSSYRIELTTAHLGLSAYAANRGALIIFAGRAQRVPGSILTTSSIPKTLVYQGFSAFLCLKKNRPENGRFLRLLPLVATGFSCCQNEQLGGF